MLNYSVGDKVVCCNADFPEGILKFYEQLPVKDTTYVVRDIRLGAGFDMKGDISVLLIGVVNPKAESKAALERGFRADRFRLLEELRDESRQRQEDKQKDSKPIEVETEVETPEFQPA